MARTVLTYEGLQAAPDDGLRRELLGGDLYVSPAPSPDHQRVVGALYLTLASYAKEHGGEAFVSPIDVVFSQVDAVQPDVVYVGRDQINIIGPKNIQGAPTFLAEVLSPASSDVDPGRKLETYASHGVQEYWVVDPSKGTAVAHSEPSGRMYLRTITGAGATIDSITLPGLTFTILSSETKS